jgi:UDP-glucose 4-epimerase
MQSLVTGGAGFIGSHLVDRLLEVGDRVTVLDDLSTGALENLKPAIERGARFVEGDVRDAAQVAEVVANPPDRIFHLAAQVDVRVSVAEPVFDGDVNVLGTINMLEAARVAGSRFLFASTGGAIYGEGHDRELPFSEETIPGPDSPYGQSKFASEGYCGVYRRLYGMDAIALRLGNVYGPRQNLHGEAGVIAMFCGRLLEHRPVTVYGDGSQTRDYIYVHDVVDGLIAAAEGGGEGPYNLGTGVETSVLTLVAELSSIFGFTDGPEFAPKRTGEILNTSISPARAKAELGWRATVGIENGLTRTADWVRGQSAAAD